MTLTAVQSRAMVLLYELFSPDGRKTKDDLTSRSVFVAYPWSVASREDYKDAYRGLQQDAGVSFLFAEDRISDDHVIDKILRMIRGTAFGIYARDSLESERNARVRVRARNWSASHSSRSNRREPNGTRCQPTFAVLIESSTGHLRSSERRSRLLAEFFPSGQL